MKHENQKRVNGMTLRTGFLTLMVLFLGIFAVWAQGLMVDLDKAVLVAQGHINAVAQDFPGEYAGAKVIIEPTLCLDFQGNPSAYIFSVMKNGSNVGYVTVGATDDGPVVIESSNGFSPLEKAEFLYEADGKTKDELLDDISQARTTLYYIQGIEYYMNTPQCDWDQDGFIRLTDFSRINENHLLDLQERRNAFLNDPLRKASFTSQWDNILKREQPNLIPNGSIIPSITLSSIHVDWPSASNQYMNRGTQYTITWSTSGISYVKIDLYKGGIFNRNIAPSIPASQRYFYWTPPSTSNPIVPGSEYKIRISDTANSSIYDMSDNNFYITGSRVVSGIDPYAYTWYRGCTVTADTMILSFIGDHGFPDLGRGRFPVTTFNWSGPDSDPRTIARGLADLLANDRGFPQSGGIGDDYGCSLSQEVASVQSVVQRIGYGMWTIPNASNPSADTYRQVIDYNRPGKMGFIDGDPYDGHATTFIGYSFYTNSSNRNQRIIYLFDTSNFAYHAIAYESQNTFNYYDANPPQMVVSYPSAYGISINPGQTIEIEWGSWASQTGSANVKIELYKGSTLNRTITSSTSNDGSDFWTVPIDQTAGADYKIKITSTSNTSIYDTSDNNFTINQTDQTLTVNGSPVAGNIESPGAVDWYKFTIPSSGTYTIETWAGSLTDNYMYLYGPNSKTTPIEEDDDDGVGNAAKIIRYLSLGTYYVKIRAYSSTGTGTYTIQVRLDSSPVVTTFAINNGASSTTSRIVTLNNTCTGSPTYYMASESSSFSGASWQTYSNAPPFTLSSGNGTKTVYFKVKNSVGRESNVVSDQITLNEFVILTVNAPPVTGIISPAGDEDWYKFTITSSGTYTIETWAGSLTDNYMYLYGPNSQTTLIEYDDDDGEGNAARITRSLSPGTYYVKIRAYSSTGTGTYTIQVRASESFVVLPINGSPITGNIESAGVVDWYKFTITSSGTYTIESWAGSLTDNYMYLYGPNSQTTLIEEDDDDGVGNAAKITRYLSPGTYYVKIRAYSSTGTGDYTIQLRSGS